MTNDQPSRTALEVAMFRAAHQILDEPRVFDDPLALRIVGQQAESAIRSNANCFRQGIPIRAVLAARSRYAEDELAQALQRGVRQYVILGAGLDTFAYRSRDVESGLRVFEVDHLATQNWKRRRLLEEQIEIPKSLTYVSFDFEKVTLAEGLSQAGFRRDESAFVSLLGTVVFLQRATVMSIFEFVGSLPRNSALVFDYGISPSALTDQQRAERDFAARQSAAIGEPFVTFFDPPSLAQDLQQVGFHEIEDFGYEETNARYFPNRSDGLCVGSSGRRLFRARV